MHIYYLPQACLGELLPNKKSRDVDRVMVVRAPCRYSPSIPTSITLNSIYPPSPFSSEITRTFNMPNLKQGTLSFASAKRTNSALSGKQQRTPVTEKGKNKRVEAPVAAKNDAKANEAHEISSDEEGTAATQITVPAKRTHASTKTRTSSGTTKQALPSPQQFETQKGSQAGIEKEHLDVEDKAGRYRKYYHEVRSKMGYISPGKHGRLVVNVAHRGEFIPFAFIVHSEGQNRIHQMLRFFDL